MRAVFTFLCLITLLCGACGSGIRAYEQLGYRAFGTPGKMAAGIAITLQNIGGEAACSHLSVCASSLLFSIFWLSCYTVYYSHVQLPLHSQVWVSFGHPGIPEGGQTCWVSSWFCTMDHRVCIFVSTLVCIMQTLKCLPTYSETSVIETNSWW